MRERLVRNMTNLTTPLNENDICDAEFNAIGNLPIKWTFKTDWNLDTLIDSIRTQARKHKIKMFVIDYFGIIESNTGLKQTERVFFLDNAANRLHTLAVEEDVVIVAMTQMNRGGEKDTRPTLNEIRGGDGLALASDVVMALWNPDEWEENETRRRNDRRIITIVKTRVGTEGDVETKFVGGRYRIFEEKEEDVKKTSTYPEFDQYAVKQF